MAQKDPVNMKVKLAIIAAATKAVEYKSRNPDASDDEVIRHVTENSDEIIEGLY